MGEARGRWTWPHYLALIGVPILALETWTVGAWLIAGPHQITEFRSPGQPIEWWGARGFELFAILLSIFVISRLVRGIKEQGRFFTFDVIFCIACATLFWANAGNNVFAPMFSISSAFVNLNDTCGFNPLVVNPECGQFANPIIFLGLFEVFGLLGCAMLLGGVANRLRARNPGISNAKIFFGTCLGGCVLVLGEPITLLPLHLWSFPGAPLAVEIGGTGFSYPFFPEVLVFGLWIGIISAVRIFKDDRGLTIVERGLERHGSRVRTVITILAMYAVVQLATWGPSTAPMWILGFNQHAWPELPAHIQNGLCDTPGSAATRYGPCPGSPGFRMPIKSSFTPQ